MKPTFGTLDDTTGFEVVDPIETRRFTFSTPKPVELTPADTDHFQFPVSSACTVETSTLELPYTVVLHVRDTDGNLIADLNHNASAEFPLGAYLLEFGGPIKFYLYVESEVRIESDTDTTRIEFNRETTVKVGARSFHKSPGATVTTTDDPGDMMAAVSTFGSVLKTTTCERSWPTLRGHPPRIEYGNELTIPDELDRPDTGVTVEVPPELDAIYPVAPLAYYFGAEIVSGETPRMSVGGFERRFDEGDGFEEEVVRTLTQAFVFDCVTRTEGYYPIELADRNRIEPLVDLDFAALYDAPLDEQLEKYFSIPYSMIAEAMPKWHRVTHVRPDPENVEALPYLVNDLSIVRTPPKATYEETEEMRETRDAIDGFKRTNLGKAGSERCPERAKNTTARRGVPPIDDYVQMPEVDALEQAWVGEGTPTRGTKVLSEAFRNETSEEPPDQRLDANEGVIDITVVCNDEDMRDEWDAVAEVYGSRETISFNPSVYFDVTTDELRELLETSTDLFHYVGHIDGRGFECSDGLLDARTIDTVGMKAFLLNACRSHNQGVALVEAGSHGGIVSLGNVGNPAAVELGETLAKLFHAGFSIGGALAITRKATFVGSRYIAVGDPGFTLTQSDDVIPLLHKVEEQEDGILSLTIHGYLSRDNSLGSISTTFLDSGPYFLSTGPYKSQSTEDEMRDVFLDIPYSPLIIDGKLVLIHEWIDERQSD